MGSRRRFLGFSASTMLGYWATGLPTLDALTAFPAHRLPLPQGFGLAYGPYRQHESPDGLQPTEEEIREDLKLLKEILPEPRRLRVYSALGPGGLAAIIAAEEGFLVTLGAWLDEDPGKVENNERELAELIGLVPIVRPELVVVGNETLLRINTNRVINETEKEQARERLKDYLRRARAALPDVILSTAEPWATWTRDPTGAQLVDLVDLLTVHVHPFWEGAQVAEGPEAVFRNLGEVKSKFGKPVILGETGWPSDGIPQERAIPSEENQRAFIAGLLRLAEMQSDRVFLFSAFDEPFKGVAERGSNTEASAEGPTGAHWGVFFWNRTLKPLVREFFGSPGAPQPASLLFHVLTRGSLAPGFDLDVRPTQPDWVRQLTPAEAERPDELPAFRLAFPANQCWGSLSITTRRPTPDIAARRTTDLGDFDRLALDLRLLEGNDAVEVAPKNPAWPDDGTESKVLIWSLTREWQTAVIPLSHFAPTDRRRLYVMCALDFFGSAGKTIDVAEIRFLPPGVNVSSTLTVAPLLARHNLAPEILREGQLSCGYGMGVASADPPVYDWVQAQPGFLRLAYPGGRAWGAAFFTIGNPPPPGGNVLRTDLSGWTLLALEVRVAEGATVCRAGIRGATSSALIMLPSSPDWNWVFVPLNLLSAADRSQAPVVAALEFAGLGARTVEVRNMRLLT